MVREISDEYRRLTEYRRGWKHGAGSAAQLTSAGEYGRGYHDGFEARVAADVAATKRLEVSNRELMLSVLR